MKWFRPWIGTSLAIALLFVCASVDAADMGRQNAVTGLTLNEGHSEVALLSTSRSEGGPTNLTKVELAAGKHGTPLRWLPPADDSLARAPHPSAVREHLVREVPVTGGLRKAEDAPAILVPTPDAVADSEFRIPAQAPLRHRLARPSDSLSDDPWSNPFGDPPTTNAGKDREGLTTGPAYSSATLVRGNNDGSSQPKVGTGRREMPPLGSAQGNGALVASLPSREELSLVLPTMQNEAIEPPKPSSPLWLVLAQKPAEEPPQSLVPPLREIEPSKPLEDQLAAGPLVSPDVCPEPADTARKLPQGLAPITALNHEVPTGKGRLPQLCPMSTQELMAPAQRGWQPVTFTWKASALCHKPAYFEQVQVERYGHSFGPILQPIVSGAHFFATVPMLPYKMGLYPPTECIYTLGHYRPGNCAPYMLDPLPLSLRAGLFQAGAWVAGAFVVP